MISNKKPYKSWQSLKILKKSKFHSTSWLLVSKTAGEKNQNFLNLTFYAFFQPNISIWRCFNDFQWKTAQKLAKFEHFCKVKISHTLQPLVSKAAESKN